jgi:hypothetical protein
MMIHVHALGELLALCGLICMPHVRMICETTERSCNKQKTSKPKQLVTHDPTQALDGHVNLPLGIQRIPEHYPFTPLPLFIACADR